MRRGRPRTEGQPYDQPVNTYLTAGQSERFAEAARMRGIGKAAMMRALVHQFLDGEALPRRRPRQVQAEAVRALNAIGVNLNQAVRVLNGEALRGDRMSAEVMAQVQSTLTSIREVITRL